MWMGMPEDRCFDITCKYIGETEEWRSAFGEYGVVFSDLDGVSALMG